MYSVIYLYWLHQISFYQESNLSCALSDFRHYCIMLIEKGEHTNVIKSNCTQNQFMHILGLI